jgi:putative ABC transport system permease protein
MESIAERLRRVRSLFRREAIESGLSEEIQFHIEQQIEKNVRAGMSVDEARRRAFVRFGGVEHVKEQTRDQFRPALLEDLWRDLAYGARVLRRAPGFAFVSIVTLALGIGAATAVFSVVNGVLLSPLPYPQPDAIVRLFQIDAAGLRNGNVSEPNFNDWKEGARSFTAMAETSAGPAPIAVGNGETTMTPGAGVSREFFDVMGVKPIVGRGFVTDELAAGGRRAVVVSNGFWRTRLNGAALDGLTMRINGETYDVVGVMPPAFDYPVSSQYWFPRELSPPQTSRTAHNFQVVGRLTSPGALAAARTELSGIARALKTRYGDTTWMSDATAVPLREQLTAATRPVLLILFGAAVMLLVVACLNVSNLQLARASARRREIAVRLAVGAGRGRITRQLLAEAIVLAAAAAALGMAIAFGGVQALTVLQPGNLPRIQNVQIDWPVMLFAIGIALITAVALGVVTAARASKQQIRETLTEGTRSVAGGRASERVRQALVVAQVALTIVLLIGAGLLTRSFVRLLSIDPGFRTDDALILDLSWPFDQDASVRRRRAETQSQILARLQTLPGVTGVGLVSPFPLGTGNFANGQFLEMSRPDEVQSFEDFARLGRETKSRIGFAGYRTASEGYFSTMNIPLVRGRLFDDRDGPDAPHVALISESLAAAKWPNQDPLGRFIEFGNMDGDLRGFTVVGVVGDVRESSPEALPGPLFYANFRQRMNPRFSIVVRSAQTASLAQTTRQVIREIDPAVPVQIRTVDDALNRAIAGRRFSLTLIGVFSVVALVLATLGIYGLISYLVAERTREIGIRLALGAASSDVLRMVLGKGATLAAGGMAVGLIASLGLTGLLKGMLFGITATDPIAFAGVIALTMTAVLGASYLPARRALKVAPVTALRGE